MNKLSIYVTRGLVLLLSIFSTAAFAADDRKNYNGNNCDNYFGSQVKDFNHQTNGIKNTNNVANRYISCPIIADKVAKQLGTSTTRVHYTGNNRVTCTLQSRQARGGPIQSRSATRFGTGWLSIQPITVEQRFGTFSMYCLLPPQGVINTISVVEKD